MAQISLVERDVPCYSNDAVDILSPNGFTYPENVHGLRKQCFVRRRHQNESARGLSESRGEQLSGLELEHQASHQSAKRPLVLK